MKLKQAFNGLKPVNAVVGKRSTYHVFANDSKTAYVLLTMKDAESGYFSIVDKKLTDLVYKHSKGKKGITCKMLLQHKRLDPHFQNKSFRALKCLYTLAALKKAKIDVRKKEKALHFNVN